MTGSAMDLRFAERTSRRSRGGTRARGGKARRSLLFGSIRQRQPSVFPISGTLPAFTDYAMETAHRYFAGDVSLPLASGLTRQNP